MDDHLATMMLTLGLYLMLSTGILVAFGPESPKFAFPVTGTIREKGLYIPVENFVVLSVCLVAISVVYVVIYRTDFGLVIGSLPLA